MSLFVAVTLGCPLMERSLIWIESDVNGWPVAQVRARSLYIQARNTRSSGANLGFAMFRRRQPQMS
jgi:hypothetical protein